MGRLQIELIKEDYIASCNPGFYSQFTGHSASQIKVILIIIIDLLTTDVL